jgi:hypothetical protein
MRKNNGAERKGYFLFELSLVLILFVMLFSGTTMTVLFFNRIMVRTELEKLYFLCRYIQWHAISSNKEQKLLFDAYNNSYSFQKEQHALPAQVLFGVPPGTKGPPSQPSHVIHRPITFVNNQIAFYPTGIMSAGTIYLKEKTESAVYALSNAVSQVSFLRLYHYNGAWICNSK